MNRIGYSFRFSRASAYMMDAQLRLSDAQQRVTTGKKFTRVSQDPVGGGIVVSTNRLLERVSQFSDNLNSAKASLSTQENALGEMTSLLQRANTLAINGANDTLDQTQRDAIAQEVRSVRDSIVKLSNTQDARERFIFAGQNNESKPYSVDTSGNLVFGGDDLPISAEIRSGEYLRTNVEGTPGMFQGIFDTLTSLEENLKSGSTQLVSDENLVDLKNSLAHVNAVRGQVGIGLKTVDSELVMNIARQDDLKKQISSVQEVDMAEAIVDYQLAENAYTAALQSATRGASLSLLDFMQ